MVTTSNVHPPDQRIDQLYQLERSHARELVARANAERDRLAGALEREQIANAELRRLLGNAQQRLGIAQSAARLLSTDITDTDVPAAAPPLPVTPPAPADTTTVPAAVERALKDAGLKGKKVRRKLVERLGALLGVGRWQGLSAAVHRCR